MISLFLPGALVPLDLARSLGPEHRPIVADESVPVILQRPGCSLCGGKGYLNSFGFGVLNGPCPQCQGDTT